MPNDKPVTTNYEIAITALEEIAVREVDEGDDVSDEPTFGARHYINIARIALAKIGGYHVED